MPYLRIRGNQLAVVHGEREPGTGKVQQRILFTVYSQPEALEILGRGGEGGDFRFQQLLQQEYPDLKFNWKQILRDIQKNLAALPEHYEYTAARLQHRFREGLCAFTRALIQADPQTLLPAARLIDEHRHELEYLADLIQFRLKLREQEPSRWNADNPFYWRFALQGRDVPPDTEEHAAGFYERGEYDRAEAIFRLLIDCFGDWAEGYNYLGLIAYQRRRLDEAAAHFEKTMELGRKLFPTHLAKKRYWLDLHTRPFMRGLRNLTMTRNERGRYEEALTLCTRLAEDCADELTADGFRASILLNTGQWKAAAEAAHRSGGDADPAEGFQEALARFELDELEEALALFLGAALRYPRAARILLGLRMLQPKSADEARDHKVGVSLCRALHAYRKQQSPRSVRFFTGLVKDPRVVRLLDESVSAARAWFGTRDADGAVFNRLSLIRSRAFARCEAQKLRDLLPTAHRDTALQ
jgi:tetratricopeptide (TPR) repeat protein